MDKQTLKANVETAIRNRMVGTSFKNAFIHIPNGKRFPIREFVEGNEKTAVMAYGKDSGEFGIYTQTNFIPLSELSYRELENVLYAVR